MADCHLGSWSNHPELRDMSLRAFRKAIDICIDEGVDFILIAGDLFDTSIPSIDILRDAVGKLKECADRGIPVYTIAGSHDFSPTRKTMLSVLEHAGLIIDVAKYGETDGRIKLDFTQDEKTGAKIAGIVGRKGGLEREIFEKLDCSHEDGFKIFMFHSAIDEYRPKHLKEMAAIPLSALPRGMNYYASGHVHSVFVSEDGKIVFPGVLFPTDFQELEKCNPGFFLVHADGKLTTERRPVKICDVVLVEIAAENKSVAGVTKEIMESIEKEELDEKILLLKISGCLESGRPTDIDFKRIISRAYDKGAQSVKKNVSRLTAKEFEEVQVKDNIGIEEMEKDIIKQHLGQIKMDGNEEELTTALMNVLKDEKREEETNASYENRVLMNAKKVVGL
jgi:hypothetical protein